jgi:hypothetical protein
VTVACLGHGVVCKMSTSLTSFPSDDMSEARFRVYGSFRTRVAKWMDSLNMPLTPRRELFLSKYDALQSLRGIQKNDVRCLQSAMEVLLNLSRHPARQAHYLNAVNRRLADAIVKAAQLKHIPADNGLLWDCPGHVDVPDGSCEFHFAVLPDDERYQGREGEDQQPVIPGPEPQPVVVNMDVAERIYAAPPDVDPPPSIRLQIPRDELVNIVHNIDESSDDDVVIGINPPAAPASLFAPEVISDEEQPALFCPFLYKQ